MTYRSMDLRSWLRWALPLIIVAACEVPDSAGPTPVPERNVLFKGDDVDAGVDEVDAGGH